MRIAVMGAGAVGCWFGGLLARAGHEVVLVGRAAHVEAMNAAGLRLESADLDEHVAVTAAEDAAAIAGAHLVLVCVKSSDSEDAADRLRPHLAPGALVLSLQNGIDNAERIARRLPDARVLPAVVYVATEMAGPGHVRHHGRGDLVVGAGDRTGEIAEVFGGAGVPVRVVDDVRVGLWAKLAANCGWNALSAVTQRPYGWLHEVEGVPRVVRDVLAECRAVAAAEGLTLPGSLEDDVLGLAATMPDQRSSTAQDLARGRRSEIDHLNGYVARRGDELGVPAPVNRALTATVVAIERANGEGRGPQTRQEAAT